MAISEGNVDEDTFKFPDAGQTRNDYRILEWISLRLA